MIGSCENEPLTEFKSLFWVHGSDDDRIKFIFISSKFLAKHAIST